MNAPPFLIYRGNWEEFDTAETLEEAQNRIKTERSRYPEWRMPVFNIYELKETFTNVCDHKAAA